MSRPAIRHRVKGGGIRSRRRRAFTLVELLVSVGVVAVLTSVVVPTVMRIRRAAQTAGCAANLRQVLFAMRAYTLDDPNGRIPGGPVTTGRFLFNANWTANPAYGNANCPGVSQIWDWMAPLAKYLQIGAPAGGSISDRVARFDLLRRQPAFTCPANDVYAPAYTGTGGPAASNDLVPSYATATQFHLLPTGTGGRAGLAGVIEGSADLTPPAKYEPLFVRIGQPGEKIFVADGARYSNADSPPDVNLDYDSPGGGAFGDMGPWSNKTNCWDRSHAAGNVSRGAVDARIYAFRHGVRAQFGPTDAYKLNAGFFDGHVETLGDLQASDPHLWMPRGSYYNPKGTYPLPKDALARYGGTLPNNRIR